MILPDDWIAPNWDAPARVRSLVTTRNGGDSAPPFASMNLGLQVGDDASTVMRNRALLRACLPAEPRWLKQVHGSRVIDARVWNADAEADAIFTREAGVVCAVMMADCMPVLLCDRLSECVAVAHAGWRGLSGGVIENTLAAMGKPASSLVAYLGPAIGATAFEVGDDVFYAFTSHDAKATAAFQLVAPGKWLCDLFMLARQRLAMAGVTSIYGGEDCTYRDAVRFFSHRRDRVSGRMAALIWIDEERST